MKEGSPACRSVASRRCRLVSPNPERRPKPAQGKTASPSNITASNVIAINVIASSVIAINVIAINVIASNVIAINVIAINVIAINVIAINVIAINVIAINVIAINVIARNIIAINVIASNVIARSTCDEAIQARREISRAYHPSIAAPPSGKEDAASLHKWMASLVAQKVGSVETAADFFRLRAGAAQSEDLHALLARAPDSGDERLE
jgi:hypothetical protein